MCLKENSRIGVSVISESEEHVVCIPRDHPQRSERGPGRASEDRSESVSLPRFLHRTSRPSLNTYLPLLHDQSSSEAEEDERSSDVDCSDDDMDREDDDGLKADKNSKFCTNCTGRMSADEELCEDCGHCPSQDDALFAAIQMQSSSAARNEQRVALLYDERMELHVEGGASPHPERPDRIRAVMARLLSTGLGGDHNCIDVACEAESNLA